MWVVVKPTGALITILTNRLIKDLTVNHASFVIDIKRFPINHGACHPVDFNARGDWCLRYVRGTRQRFPLTGQRT